MRRNSHTHVDRFPLVGLSTRCEMGVELTSAYALGKQPALLYSIPNVPNVHHVLACKKDSTQGIGGKPFPLIIRAAAALLTVDQTEQQLAASGVVCVGDLKIDRPKDTNQGERNMHASICLHASPSRTLENLSAARTGAASPPAQPQIASLCPARDRIGQVVCTACSAPYMRPVSSREG